MRRQIEMHRVEVQSRLSLVTTGPTQESTVIHDLDEELRTIEAATENAQAALEALLDVDAAAASPLPTEVDNVD